VGALFYIEPTQTQDIDIFISLETPPGSSLVSVQPIIERLKDIGYRLWRDDKLVVENWPVQFLPATKAIEREAIERAVEKPLEEGVTAWIPTAEYLMLMAIDLARPKDVIRLYQFHSQKVYDPAKLRDLLTRHRLSDKWDRILKLFQLSGEG
jgi:hypothetical protein